MQIIVPKLTRLHRFTPFLAHVCNKVSLCNDPPASGVRPSVRLSAVRPKKLKRRRFLRHYDPYSLETWHNGALWRGLSDYTILSDLHPRSWTQRLVENLEKLKHRHFLRRYGHCDHETWHKGTLWEGLSVNTSLSDLHSRSWTQWLMENLEKLKHCHFLRRYSH